MPPENDAATAATGAAASAAPTTPAASDAVTFPSSAAFKARLDEATAAATRAALRDLGFDDAAAAKGALAKARELEAATLTEQQKLTKRVEDLAPLAARATALEATIKEALAIEEAALPEDKRGLLDLAPTEPGARLAWLTKARAKKLFEPTSAAAPTTETKAANTRAGGTAPAAGGGTPLPKRASQMTPEERKREIAERTAKLAESFK